MLIIARNTGVPTVVTNWW